MNKNDPRVIKTLRQIDEALLECLTTSPIEKITIEMLCRCALINRTTFYKYYNDKYNLLEDYLDRTLDEFKSRLDGDFILAPVSHMNDQIYMNEFMRLVEFMKERKEQYLTLWRASINRNVFDEMILLVQQSIIVSLNNNAAPSSRTQAYTDLYSYLFASNMMALVHWWFMNDQLISPEDVRSIMTHNMKVGLFKAFKDFTR